jgi:hypothetical protein
LTKNILQLYNKFSPTKRLFKYHQIYANISIIIVMPLIFAGLFNIIIPIYVGPYYRVTLDFIFGDTGFIMEFLYFLEI